MDVAIVMFIVTFIDHFIDHGVTSYLVLCQH
jgi:hypothetical protein